MTKRQKLVRGVGANDADYPVTTYATIGGRQKQMWVCPIYLTWAHMLERCYSAKFQAKCPTYAECSVAPEWHSFSAFRDWMVPQDHEGKQLDKDILLPGNKVYSSATCVFITRQINTFMLDCGAARGDHPLGVFWHKRIGKLAALCNNPFTRKQEHLGYFTDPAEAHAAWRLRKHELACIYADQQTDQRIAQALRTRYAKEGELQ